MKSISPGFSPSSSPRLKSQRYGMPLNLIKKIPGTNTFKNWGENEI
jgi:hypothetical protein